LHLKTEEPPGVKTTRLNFMENLAALERSEEMSEKHGKTQDLVILSDRS
jgi:hypothetical protein